MSRELCVFVNALSVTPSDSVVKGQVEADALAAMKRMWGVSKTAPLRFLGPNPVSIDRRHLADLRQHDYLVSLKSDGVRYLLLLTVAGGEPKAFMVNRRLTVFEVEIWGDEAYFARGTLLDGELVWDYESGEGSLRFIIFDAICIKGKSLVTSKYSDRLMHLNSTVLLDYSGSGEEIEDLTVEEDKIVAMNNKCGLRLSVKRCCSFKNVARLWERRQESSHQNDGLIFTKNDEPIVSGTCRSMFKWKPTNTVDVRIVCSTAAPCIFISRDGTPMEITKALTTRSSTYAVRLSQNGLYSCLLRDKRCDVAAFSAIVECTCSIAGDSLELFPIKERLDKPNPNDWAIVCATIDNVIESIQFNEFVDADADADADRTAATCAADAERPAPRRVTRSSKRARGRG